MEVVQHLLEFSGIGRDRMAVRWVSAAEGQLFAEHVRRFTDRTRELGPFDPERFRLPLAASETALNSARLRWLMGMEIQITERGNVYGEKMKQEDYGNILKEAARNEYEKALILQVLGEGVQSVRDIALKTGLPVYTVSLHMGELERGRQAAFHGFDGKVSLFSAAQERSPGAEAGEPAHLEA